MLIIDHMKYLKILLAVRLKLANPGLISVLSETLNEFRLTFLNQPVQFLNEYSDQIGLISSTLSFHC